MVVDIGRSCSKRPFSFFVVPPYQTADQFPQQTRGVRASLGFCYSPPPLVRVRWYFAPVGAKPLPFPTIWGSTLWSDDYERAEQTIGEVPNQLLSKWNNGRPPDGATGQHFCGSVDDFQIPKTWGGPKERLKRGPSGLPLCCNAHLAALFAVESVSAPNGKIGFQASFPFAVSGAIAFGKTSLPAAAIVCTSPIAAGGLVALGGDQIKGRTKAFVLVSNTPAALPGGQLVLGGQVTNGQLVLGGDQIKGRTKAIVWGGSVEVLAGGQLVLIGKQDVVAGGQLALGGSVEDVAGGQLVLGGDQIKGRTKAIVWGGSVEVLAGGQLVLGGDVHAGGLVALGGDQIKGRTKAIVWGGSVEVLARGQVGWSVTLNGPLTSSTIALAGEVAGGLVALGGDQIKGWTKAIVWGGSVEQLAGGQLVLGRKDQLTAGGQLALGGDQIKGRTKAIVLGGDVHAGGQLALGGVVQVAGGQLALGGEVLAAGQLVLGGEVKAAGGQLVLGGDQLPGRTKAFVLGGVVEVAGGQLVLVGEIMDPLQSEIGLAGSSAEIPAGEFALVGGKAPIVNFSGLAVHQAPTVLIVVNGQNFDSIAANNILTCNTGTGWVCTVVSGTTSMVIKGLLPALGPLTLIVTNPNGTSAPAVPIAKIVP